MLNDNRAFVIKCKCVLERIIIWFASKLPEPTKENVVYPNSLILLNIQDRFFSHYRNDSKWSLFHSAWKVFVIEYEHDPHYRHIFDWLLEEIFEEVINGRWQPRPPGTPQDGWVEQRPNGLFRGRNFKQYIKEA
jgi:hypothetical protein